MTMARAARLAVRAGVSPVGRDLQLLRRRAEGGGLPGRQKFEVQNLAIVGTDLKSVERVLGRRNWGTVLNQGVMSGISTGLLVALVMLIFTRPPSVLVLLLVSLAIGIVLGIGFAAAAYAMSRGQRDFTSVTQTVATKYEVLCEHKVAARAREMLQQMPGARAAAFE